MFRLPVSWVGIDVEKVTETEEKVLVMEAVSTAQTAICPDCGEVSQHIHSYYLRSPQDLPMSGYQVCFRLRVRRFRCGSENCPRKTFAERLPEVVPFHSQRTTRLTTTLTLFALVLSGEAGERLLNQIGMADQRGYIIAFSQRHRSPIPCGANSSGGR